MTPKYAFLNVLLKTESIVLKWELIYDAFEIHPFQNIWSVDI